MVVIEVLLFGEGMYASYLYFFKKKKSLIFTDIAQLKTATLSGYGLKSGLSLPDVGKRFSLDLSVSTCSILMTPSTFGYSMYFFSMTLMKTIRHFVTNGTATQ